ncbi:MAG: bleomycin resistance protein [Candidatus Angelobacter sp. Gp1-AA117]|nr:MAG: bleomycin resistance protein [Candidatus Angelobacter sp. Gp1-AA117]
MRTGGTVIGPETKTEKNVKQAVPFFGVTDMQASLRFYQDGLGFTMKYQWIDEGKLRWCWLELGDAALMLQEFRKGSGELYMSGAEGKLGTGVSICFMCEDAIAIFREVTARGIEARRPFVGNRLWVTGVVDPDGYKLFFESPTDAPEESVWNE